MQNIYFSKINVFWLYEISWFPWQPIMRLKIIGVYIQKYEYLNSNSSYNNKLGTTLIPLIPGHTSLIYINEY